MDLRFFIGSHNRLNLTDSFMISGAVFLHFASADFGRCIFAEGPFSASICNSFFAHTTNTGSPCTGTVHLICPTILLRRCCFVDCVSYCAGAANLQGSADNPTTVDGVTVSGCNLMSIEDSQNLFVVLYSPFSINGFNSSNNAGTSYGIALRLTPAAPNVATLKYSIASSITSAIPVYVIDYSMAITFTNFVSMQYTNYVIRGASSSVQSCVFLDNAIGNVKKAIFLNIILADCVFDCPQASVSASSLTRCSYNIPNPNLYPVIGAIPDCHEPTYLLHARPKLTVSPMIFLLT